MTENNLNDRLDLRITPEDKQDFINRCHDLKRRPQSMMREIVKAFNEKRLRIRVTDDLIRSQQELYDVN